MGKGRLLNWDEAGAVIKSITDSGIQRLVVRGLVIARNKFRTGVDGADADLDVKFLAETLAELFSDANVIRKELAGEQPGAWFDESDLQAMSIAPTES